MDAATAIDHVKLLLARLGLEVELSQAPGGAIIGHIVLTDGALPVGLLPGGGAWRLALSQGAAVSGAIKALGPLLGGDNLLAAVLPPDILELASLTLEVLNVQFDTNITVPTQVSYTLRAPSPWVIIKDKLVLHQLRSDVAVLEPLSNARLRLDLSGMLRAGGIDLPLAASLPQGFNEFDLPGMIKEWPFTLKNFAGELKFGALLDALGLAAFRKALEVLPGDLSQLAMPLSALGLVWDVDTGSLVKVNALLTPQDAKLDVSLKPVCKASLRLTRFEVVYDIEMDAWSAVGDAKLELSDFPDELKGILPTELSGHLEIRQAPDKDDYEVVVSTDAVEKLKEIEYGLRKLGSELSNVELRWPGGSPVLGCDLQIATGNAALGGMAHLPIKDTLRFRVVLDPVNADHPLRFSLLEWPFTIFDVPVMEGKLRVRLGKDFSADVELPGLDLNFPMPEALETSGVITVTDAAIPLPFMHNLAAAVGLGKYVPDRIPVIENGKPVPIALPTIDIDEDCRPADLAKYASIKLPSAFDYSMALTTDGSLDLGLTPKTPDGAHAGAAGTMVSGLPPLLLAGTQVEKLGWGEFFGVQTAVISAQGDVFSPLLIKVLAAVSCHGNPFLPKSSDLRCFWRLGNVRLLLIAPIPVPIFFDPIELHYLGVEGLGIDLHWRLPEPSLLDKIELVQQVVQFLADRGQDLDLAKLPVLEADPLLKITLPKYLGGVPLSASAEVDSHEVVESLLRFVKSPSPAGIVAVIPRQYRLGKVHPKLGPIGFEAEWALTSADEWEDSEVRAEFTGKLGDEAVNVAMAILGSAHEFGYGRIEADAVVVQQPQADESIVVSRDSVLILVGGGFDLGLVEGSITVGLAQIGSGGFAAAVAAQGALLKVGGRELLGFQLKAVVRAFNDDQSLSLLAGGMAEIRLLGEKLFDANVFLTNDAFFFRVATGLPAFLPVSGILDVSGSLTSNGSFSLAGFIRDFKLGPIELAQVSAKVTNQTNELLSFAVKLFGMATVMLSIDDTLTLRGAAGMTIGGSFDLPAVSHHGVTIIPAATVEVPSIETKVAVWVGPTRLGISGQLGVKVIKGVIEGAVPFSLEWDLSDIPTTADALWAAIEEFLRDALLRRPIQILGDIGMKVVEWVGLALRWGAEKLDQLCKKLGEAFVAAGQGALALTRQISAATLAGLARLDPTTALGWDPSGWVKAIQLPVVTWDLAWSFKWDPGAWNLALELPLDFWSAGELREVTIEEFGNLVKGMAETLNRSAEEIVGVVSRMFTNSPEAAAHLVNKVSDFLGQLNPGAAITHLIPSHVRIF